MPALTGGGALNSGVATYPVTVPATITSDGVFLVVDTTAIGTLYKVTSIENANSKTSDLIPIRTRTASSLTFTRGSFFNHPTGTRLATVAYECTRDVAIDGNIMIQRNGGTNANPVVDIHGVRRCRFNTIHIKQTSTTAEIRDRL